MSAFHFVNPAALWLLLAVPVLAAVWRYGDGRRRAALSAWGRSPAAMADPGRRATKRAMQAAAWVALVLVLARPARQTAAVPQAPASGDLVFLLDVSRSMLARDAGPTRLNRAREVILQIAARARGQRLALVAFAGSQAMQCPLTPDSAFFEEMVNSTDADSVTRGGTAIGGAIRFAMAHTFDDVMRDSRNIVLVSDGEDHEGTAAEAAREARRRGVGTVTIGIGDAAGALVPSLWYRGGPVVTRLEEGTLRAIGNYVAAGTGEFDAGAVYGRFLTPARKNGRPAETGDRWWVVCLAAAIVLLAAEWRVPERRMAVAALLVCALLAAPPAGFAQTVEEWFRKGESALEERRYQDAVRYFADAARWSPGRAEIRFNLGKAVYGLKSFSEAAGSFELAANAASEARLKAKCRLGQGNALFRDAEQLPGRQAVARYQAAVAAYRQAQELDPDLFDAEFNRKVAERRWENSRRESGATGALPGAAPDSHADADRILKDLGGRQAPANRHRDSGVERDW